MPSRASQDFLEKVLKSMNSIIEDRAWLITATTLALAAIITAASSYATGVLPLIPDIGGAWHFQTQGTSSCEMPYNDWNVQVLRDGNYFHGDNGPGPGVKNGYVSGIFKKNVSFSIIVENPESPDGCGDYSELSGTFKAPTISGTIVGHDCSSFCVWNGTFTVTITK